MGGIDVAAVVASILAAFGSSMDVFHRLGGKKRKTHARLPRPSEEEEWLRHSLTDRPREIRHEYDRSVAKHGRQFEVGDEVAHSSLAHTLLILNTGLLNLINHALSGDSKSKAVSRKVLYNLSETAALDTLTALGQLGSRLSIAAPPRMAAGQTEHHRKKRAHAKKEKPRSISPVQPSVQRPSPTPLLVRGGWVRSNSGSSVVSATAARKVKEEQSRKHHRSKSDTALVKSSASRINLTKSKRPDGGHEGHSAGTCRGSSQPEASPNRVERQKSSERLRQPHRQPSMLVVAPDFFDIATAPETPDVPPPPPRPPKIPLPYTRSNPRINRARPTSSMTFMTTSTKIGEIPETKWPDRKLSPDEPETIRLPYTIPPPLDSNERNNKKKRGLKFWKKEDKSREVAAC